MSYLLFAQETNSVTANDSILFSSDFFDKDKPLELTFEFNIKKFRAEKSDTTYLPTILLFNINDSVVLKKTVKIKARGELRKDYCNSPPFLLNIKNSDLYEDHFLGAYKIKVVSQCKNFTFYDSYLIKEYLGYKIFNILTDNSFKVRLIKARYIDTGRNKKVTTNWAFMIEPEKVLAERLNAYPLKMDKIKYRQTDTLATTIMSIFQYMIGNTDYSIEKRHNIKLLTLKDYTKPELIPIPYDFDYSGIVNADYAVVGDRINIKDVTERYFYGMCRTDELYNKVLELYREKKDDIFLLVNSFEYLDKRTKKHVINYLNDFYKEIDKPNFIKKYLRTSCGKFG